MSALIQSVDALEIMDSRGYPTLRVEVTLQSGHRGTASAPAGASTGQHEVPESRDNDPSRYGGRGVSKAVHAVRTQLKQLLNGRDARDQIGIDLGLESFYGKDAGQALGANVTCATSMAVARAAAEWSDLSLFRYLGGPCVRRMPVPMMNVINGGKHADNSLDFQEFMLVPHGAPSFAEALRYGAETFHALKALLKGKGFATAVGDEGGFAPDLDSEEQACELIVEAAQSAGLIPGRDVAIALDPAANSFAVEDDRYRLRHFGKGDISADELEGYYRHLVATYPIVSIEDGFAENDWDAFKRQTRDLGDRVQIVGDDLYVTDAARVRRGVTERATNAALIKINQIGSLTRTLDAVRECQDAGFGFVVSHRSGETEDTFIADFAVATGGQIKSGSLSRSERVAKYNRLLEIEHELGTAAVFESPFARRRAAA
jgi:enolase